MSKYLVEVRDASHDQCHLRSAHIFVRPGIISGKAFWLGAGLSSCEDRYLSVDLKQWSCIFFHEEELDRSQSQFKLTLRRRKNVQLVIYCTRGGAFLTIKMDQHFAKPRYLQRRIPSILNKIELLLNFKASPCIKNAIRFLHVTVQCASISIDVSLTGRSMFVPSSNGSNYFGSVQYKEN